MDSFFYVLSFDSTHRAIQTEKRMKEQFDIQVIPTPREISKSCGISLKIGSLDLEAILKFLDVSEGGYGLYQMSGEKQENGLREIRAVRVKQEERI